MKIAYTSDLHTDITLNNKNLIPYLVKRIEEINPDIFIIAGDVANALNELNSALSAFGTLDCIKVMIPGNHDVWIESNNAVKKGKDSFYKYTQGIPQICNENDFLYPVNAPIIIGDTAIVGSIGWYDYSFSDFRLANVCTARHYDKGVFNNGIWNDTQYAVWLRNPDSCDWRERSVKLSNHEIFEVLFKKFQHTLQQIPSHINEIVIVLHTAPFKECIIQKSEPCFFDAFEGSVLIGELIEKNFQNKNVSIICGHRHKKLYLERGNIKVYRSPVGYLEKTNSDYEKIAKEAIGVFDI